MTYSQALGDSNVDVLEAGVLLATERLLAPKGAGQESGPFLPVATAALWDEMSGAAAAPMTI